MGILKRKSDKDGEIESLEDAVKNAVDAGYRIFDVGLLRLSTGYTGLFGPG